MAKRKIPLKPNSATKYTLKEEEINCLRYYCVFECKKSDAFVAFIHPELAKSKALAKQLSDEFFANKEVLLFINEYRATLDEWYSVTSTPQTYSSDMSEEEFERMKSKAVRKFSIELLKMLENPYGEALDIDELAKVVDKVGLFDVKSEQVEQPRRYLPASCRACRYKAFCEEHCDDLCQYCKYKKYSEENGVYYETEKQLEMPQESGEKE